MLNILDLFPHDSSIVPEQWRNESSFDISSTLYVDLPLRYALQYGLNALERGIQDEPTSYLQPSALLPGMWVFARSQQALRDLLDADPHLDPKEPSSHHPWSHFKQGDRAFRPDLWARMVFHYCPTLYHLESFFKCIHLHPVVQQHRQQHAQEQLPDKARAPLTIMLVGFFGLAAVSKDVTASSSGSSHLHSYPYGGGGGGDQHCSHLKFVSQVMSEVKDAMQWMEKSLHRSVQLLIIEETKDTRNPEHSHGSGQARPPPLLPPPRLKDDMSLENTLAHHRLAPMTAHPHSATTTTTSPPKFTHAQSWLQSALGFWTEAVVTVVPFWTGQEEHGKNATANTVSNKEGEDGEERAETACPSSSSPSPPRTFRLFLRTRQSQRQLFVTRATRENVGGAVGGMPGHVAAPPPLVEEEERTTRNETATSGRRHRREEYHHGQSSDQDKTSEEEEEDDGHQHAQGLRCCTVSDLGGDALVLEWTFSHGGGVQKTLFVEKEVE